MHRRFSSLFWWQSAVLLLCAILVILAVLVTAYLSRAEGFLEMAARTDVLLTVVSLTLLLLICGFFLFTILYRRRFR